MPTTRDIVATVVLLSVLGAVAGCGVDDQVRTPPAGVGFDYQIGGDYPPAAEVGVVVRDWSAGEPLPGGYSLCYVNAFQTQPDDAAVDRLDEGSRWPQELVLRELGEDPGWPGEFLVDLSSEASRDAAADWIVPALDACAAKGFDAVELDNLDSWTRFDGTANEGDVPFGRQEALAYASVLARHAHDRGLAVAQKNTPQLQPREVAEVGFDLAVVEQCGRFDECAAYTAVHGDDVLVVEYDEAGFEAACRELAGQAPVVQRDPSVAPLGEPGHLSRRC